MMETYTTKKGNHYHIREIKYFSDVERVIENEGMFWYRGKLKHWTVISNMSLTMVRAYIKSGALRMAIVRD